MPKTNLEKMKEKIQKFSKWLEEEDRKDYEIERYFEESLDSAYNLGKEDGEIDLTKKYKKAFIEEFFMSGERWYNYGFENEEEKNEELKRLEEEFNSLCK